MARPPSIFAALFAALLLAAALPARALYFYLEPNTHKCFYEELPNDTVVVGHYMSEIWDQAQQKFTIDQRLGISITVREVKESHIVTATKGPPEGKFAFTSHEAGDHQICLSTVWDPSAAGGSAPPTGHGDPAHNHFSARMHLDIIIGETKPDTTQRDRAHISDLAFKVRNLNDAIRDIKKEQQFQREREADFRNLSEQTNSKALLYAALQATTLLGAAVWQLRHLKTYFNEKKIS